MHKVERVARALGVEQRVVFTRARDAYGNAHDNPTRDYNIYVSTNAIPRYVEVFCQVKLAALAGKK